MDTEKSIEDIKQERLERQWRGLIASNEAITKEKICRYHGLRLQDFDSWFKDNVTYHEKYRHGKDFFQFADGDVALLFSVDTQIGVAEFAKGMSGSERYKEFWAEDNSTMPEQTHTEDWEEMADGSIRYFKRGSSGQGRSTDIYTQD